VRRQHVGDLGEQGADVLLLVVDRHTREKRREERSVVIESSTRIRRVDGDALRDPTLARMNGLTSTSGSAGSPRRGAACAAARRRRVDVGGRAPRNAPSSAAPFSAANISTGSRPSSGPTRTATSRMHLDLHAAEPAAYSGP
jgi:hypothetical protein